MEVKLTEEGRNDKAFFFSRVGAIEREMGIV